MIIALFHNKQKKNSESIALEVGAFLLKHSVTIVTEDEAAPSLNAHPLSAISPQEVDFIISLGGDGTLLQIVHRYPSLQAPILPINLGGLGFMAEITREEIYPNLKNFLDGKFEIQQRVMMEGSFSNKETCYAVNEVTVHRAHNPSLIDLSIYLDGKYLNTFSADGIILSTPTGSTAYSLAAGGPILTPELQAFVLTPICPHTISNRPIVFMPKQEVRIEYMNSSHPIEVSYDGFRSYPMEKMEPLRVRHSQRMFKLVCMLNHDYFSTLRTKLGWTGKLRSNTPN